jgi:hypothetical protein
MPPRPIFDRAMTAAERQRRRRLRLAGGPTARFEREVLRALSAGMTAIELVQRIEALAGGIPVPAAPTSAVLGHETRDISVTTPPPVPVARDEPIPAIAARWLAEFGARLDPDRQPRRARANAKKRMIYVEQPISTVNRLSSLAHELGHIAFVHTGRVPRYVEEFQAEAFRFALLQREGFAIDPVELAHARCYVGQKIHWGHRTGGQWFDPRIAAWSIVDPSTPGLHRNWVRYLDTSTAAREAALLRNGDVPPEKQVDYYAATLDRLAEMGLPPAVLEPAAPPDPAPVARDKPVTKRKPKMVSRGIFSQMMTVAEAEAHDAKIAAWEADAADLRVAVQAALDAGFTLADIVAKAPMHVEFGKPMRRVRAEQIQNIMDGSLIHQGVRDDIRSGLKVLTAPAPAPVAKRDKKVTLPSFEELTRLCDAYPDVDTVSGIVAALGTTRATLKRWLEKGRVPDDPWPSYPRKSHLKVLMKRVDGLRRVEQRLAAAARDRENIEEITAAVVGQAASRDKPDVATVWLPETIAKAIRMAELDGANLARMAKVRPASVAALRDELGVSAPVRRKVIAVLERLAVDMA